MVEIDRVAQAFEQYRRRIGRGKKHYTYPPQLRAAARELVDRTPDAEPAEIAKALGVSPSSIKIWSKSRPAPSEKERFVTVVPEPPGIALEHAPDRGVIRMSVEATVDDAERLMKLLLAGSLMFIAASHILIKIFVPPVDMRWGYDRLAGLCSNTILEDPYGGTLFVFVNRARNRLRTLYHDGSGLCMLSKRLDAGTFPMVSLPGTDGKAAVRICAGQLMLLIGGKSGARALKYSTYPEKQTY